MEALFENGAKLDSSTGQDSVLVALKKKNMECLEILLERGFKDSSRKNRVISPLMQCIAIGLFDAVEPLIERGADIDYVDSSKSCPLQLAIKSGNLNIVKLLLEKGANIKFRSAGIQFTNLVFILVTF